MSAKTALVATGAVLESLRRHALDPRALVAAAGFDGHVVEQRSGLAAFGFPDRVGDDLDLGIGRDDGKGGIVEIE